MLVHIHCVIKLCFLPYYNQLIFLKDRDVRNKISATPFPFPTQGMSSHAHLHHQAGILQAASFLCCIILSRLGRFSPKKNTVSDGKLASPSHKMKARMLSHGQWEAKD